jgi:hypothetical protein
MLDREFLIMIHKEKGSLKHLQNDGILKENIIKTELTIVANPEAYIK